MTTTTTDANWMARLLALEALERRGFSSTGAEAALVSADMHNDFTLRYAFLAAPGVRVREELRIAELTVNLTEAVTITELAHGP